MPDQESKIRLTGEDKTAAAFASAQRNAAALTKELEKQAGVNESSARAMQIRAKDTNKSYDQMLKWSIAAQKQNEEYWAKHRAGSQEVITDNQRQATAIKGVGAELVNMAKGYLTAGTAIEAARRSFLGFADTEKKLLILQNQTKATTAEIAKFEQQIKQTGQDTATGFDDSLDAVNKLRQGLNISLDDAVKKLPRLNVVAQGLGIGAGQAAKLTSDMMRNLKIPADQFGQALEVIAAGSRDANVDIKDLVANGAEVAEVAKNIGYHGLNGLARVQTLVGIAGDVMGDTSKGARLLTQTMANLSSEHMGAMFGRTPGVWKKELEDVKEKEGDVGGYVIGLLKSRRDAKSIIDKMDIKQQMLMHKLVEEDNGSIGQKIRLLKEAANGQQAITDGMRVIGGAGGNVDSLSVSIKNLSDEFGRLLATLGVPTAIVIFTEKLKQLGETVKYVAEWVAYFNGEGARPEINIIGPHGLSMPSPGSVWRGVTGTAEQKAAKERLDQSLREGGTPTAPGAPGPRTAPGVPGPRTGPGPGLGAPAAPGATGAPGYQPSSYQGGYRGYGGAADSAYVPADFRGGGGLLHRASLGGGGGGEGGGGGGGGGASQFAPAGPQGYGGGTGYGGGGGGMGRIPTGRPSGPPAETSRPSGPPAETSGQAVAEAQGQGGLAADRAKFKAEMDANPALREKVLRIAANEQGKHGQGTQAVIESMMNRASSRGRTLAQEAKWVGEGGYYEEGNKGRGALENKAHADVLNKSLEGALAGSNITDYATDNASQGLAAKRTRNKEMEFTKEIGGESFYRPGRVSGAGNVRKHQQWMAGVQGADQGTKVASIPPGAGANLGTGSTGTSGTIPSSFGNDVAAMTAAGAKPADIQSYLARNGVDTSIATCGQFMAQQVKAHGGKPPPGANVASNWNKWGEAGYQEGGMNVAVKQGVATGQTGSHVTAAIPIRNEKGEITGYRGVGVNQGRGGVPTAKGDYGRNIVSSIPLSIGKGRGQYQIRSAPQPQPAEPAAPAAPTAVAEEPRGEGAAQQRAREEEVNVKLRVNDNDMQFARSSMRTQADKEVREARWNSYSDIGAA